MRKIILFVIIIALGIYAFNYYQDHLINYSMEQVLPQGAILYLGLKEADKFFQDIAKNETWQALKSVDYQKLMTTAGLTSKQIMFFKIINSKVFEDEKINFLIKRFFTNEAAVAFYPPGKIKIEEGKSSNEYLKDLINAMTSRVVFISRIPLDVKLAEVVTGVLQEYQNRYPTEMVPYREQTYRTIFVPEIKSKIGFVRLKDYMVIGIGEDSVKRSIDMFLDKKKPLSKDPEFVRISDRHAQSSDLLGYINLTDFFSFLELHAKNIIRLSGKDSDGSTDNGDVAEAKEAALKKLDAKFENIFQKTKGFKSIGLSITLDQVSSLIFTLFFDAQQIDDGYSGIYECEPMEDENLPMIPKYVRGYQWDACFDFDKLWNGYEKQIQSSGSSNTMRQLSSLEKQLNFSVTDDLLPAIGNEIGGFLGNFRTENDFPLPEIVFYVSSRDNEKFKKVLGALAKLPLLRFHDQAYKDYTLKLIQTPFGEKIQPVYSFVGNYWLLGTDTRLIKDSIDAFEDVKSSLLDSDDFQKVNLGLTNKNRSLKFIRLGEVSENLVNILRWGNLFLQNKEQSKDAFESGQKQRLADITQKITLVENDISDNKSKIDEMKAKIENEEAQGEAIVSLKTEISFYQDQNRMKEKELQGLKDQRKGLQDIVDGFRRRAGIKAESRQILLDEVVIPVLKSFKPVKAVGVRSTSSKELFETSIFTYSP